MKSKIFFFLFLSVFFVSCVSTSASEEKKLYQSQEEKDYLNSLNFLDKTYLEVSGINKWVKVYDITEYEYDEFSRVLVEKGSLITTRYKYDENGNKIRAESSTGHVYNYKYDENNFLVYSYWDNGYWISYKNDKNGNHIYSKDYKGEERYFEYDNLNRLTHVNNIGGKEFFYHYDDYKYSFGLVYYAKITNNQDKTESYIHNEYGNELSFSTKAPSSSNPNVMVYTYQKKSEYNKNNLLIHISDSFFGESWFAYVYDDYGRILKKIEFISM